MPRPAPTGTNGLPLWDTFEALFFLVAGLSIGIVFGVLFPSLWRTFRRRFRDANRFAPHDPKLAHEIESPLKILSESDDQTPQSTLGSTPQVRIFEAFVYARNAVQEGKSREAVKIYLDILGHEQVTKQQTNRALFELSQLYSSLGLQSRALDTGLELLYRKPENAEVLSHLLDLCEKYGHFERIKTILMVQKVTANDALRMRFAHALSMWSEKLLTEGKRKEALEMAREALRWDMISARAKLLLWKLTSEELWEKSGQDVRNLWGALATDLEARWRIGQDTRISPAAEADTLSHMILRLVRSSQGATMFSQVREEFMRTSGRNKLTSDEILEFERIVFQGLLTLTRQPSFEFSDDFVEIAKILAPSFWNEFASDPQRLVGGQYNPNDVLKVAFFAHNCQLCHAAHAQFEWKCVSCGALESLKPSLMSPQTNP